MRKKRILILMHTDLIPPDSIEGLSDEETLLYKTEFDVTATLKELGHDVQILGVTSNLEKIKDAVDEFKPHIIFNLLEEFHGIGVYDAHVVSFLELLKTPYSGCNPRGLMLAHNKALSKMICRYHRIRVPQFHVFPIYKKVRRPAKLQFPLIVKSLTEEGSVGISQASIVHNDETLAERVDFIHRTLNTDAIVEQYIEGRELYVGVLGNDRLQTFPIWELEFKKLREDAPRIATGRIKWDLKYRKQVGIDSGPAHELSEELLSQIPRFCKRAYKALMLSGYARMDLRLTPDGKIYLLEANPNPELAYGEDLAESAEKAGISYEQLLTKIISLGLRYRLRGQA
ncbi:D-alanine--D-alanine ligase family protein [Poriferisphaera sp. WC338]|uniref:D-alanine--D-alanine ligase family protein n=1 Tax=Poriferisphaera sp. WC338 TaxID=3425129 RepID=UPI003D81BEE3